MFEKIRYAYYMTFLKRMIKDNDTKNERYNKCQKKLRDVLYGKKKGES